MALKPDVLQAFSLLGIDPDSDIQAATKAYKRHALLHHPDRNRGDPEATQRFQEIGAAWNICQRHFDNPTWSYTQAQSSSTKTYHFSADDDIPLDEEELYQFYMFMFAETLFNRYSRAKGQRYRYERSGRAGGGLASFSGGLAESQERQARNTERQRKENEEYEIRKRELELEIEQEERERAAVAKQNKADADRRDNALEHAFRAASAGDCSAVKKVILDFDLDVNTSRKRPKQSRKQESVILGDSLLHAAASCCNGELFMFLIERGANPTALNKNQFNPFHSAVKAGNTRIVQFILEHRSRSFDVYHPSKATSSGCTPLQLAIDSGVPSVVELLVKYATTHDVERCWKVETISEEIREILLKKKGFVPPGASLQVSEPTAAKKSQRKQELDQQKQARIAEELERAAVNRQKREERAARRLEKERADASAKQAQEQARYKVELEELHRLEDNRRAQEARAKVLEEIRIQAEAEQRAVALRDKLEKEEKESRIRLKQEKALRMHENTKTLSEETSKPSACNQTMPVLDAPVTSTKVVSSADALTEEESKKLRYAKLKEKRQAKLAEKRRQKAERFVNQTPLGVVNTLSTSKTTEKQKQSLRTVDKDMQSMEDARIRKEEAALRRRAEQSARDKERHRRMLEEQAAKIHAQSNSGIYSFEHIPLTPVSTHTHEQTQQTSNKGGNLALLNGSHFHLPRGSLPSVVEFSMPVEDAQTCIIPDDLFRDEQPIVRPPIEEKSPVPDIPIEEEGRYRRRPSRHSRGRG